MVQFTAAEHELKGLQMHEKLAFVVVGAAAVDGFLAGIGILGYNGLEGVCTPFFQRLRRLNVIVAVNKYRLVRRIQYLLSEYYRISCRRVNRCLVGTGLQKQFYKPLGTFLHVAFVLRLGADGRDPQQ